MGKMKGDIYKYYQELKYQESDSGNNSSAKLPKWECRFCKKSYVQNATKMRHHVLNACGEIPAPLKLALCFGNHGEDLAEEDSSTSITEEPNSSNAFLDSFGGNELASLSSSSAPSKVGNNPNPKSIVKPPLKKRKSLSMNAAVSASATSSLSHSSLQLKLAANSVGMASENNESLWVLMARAIFASGSPLDMLENPFWIDVFQRISPGISLPSAQMVGKNLLEREEAKIQAEVEKHVQDAPYVGIQCESWFSKKGESMTTFVVTTPSPYSYRTYRTGGKEHNANLIAERAIECIEIIQGPGSKVLCFVSRTEEHFRSSWKKIQEAHPHVLTFACAIESLESLLGELVSQREVSEILRVAKSVVSKLKRSPLVRNKFEQIQVQINEKVRKLRGLSFSTPISILLCLQSLLNVQNAIKWLAVDDESVQSVGPDLSCLVADDFWTKVELTIKIFFPVIKWLQRLKVKAEISLVPKVFSEISDAFDLLQDSVWHHDVYPVLLDKLRHRREVSMQDVHLAANLLDPREQGACLNQDQIIQATEFIDSFAESHGQNSTQVISELSQFRMKSDFYSKPFLWKVTQKIHGAVWWSTMAPKSDLANLAAAILNICPVTFKMNKNITDTFFQGTHDSQDQKLIYVAHNLRISTNLSVTPVESKRPKTSYDTNEGNESKSASNGISPLDWEYLEQLCNRSDSDSDVESEEEENYCLSQGIISSSNQVLLQQTGDFRHQFIEVKLATADDAVHVSVS